MGQMPQLILTPSLPTQPMKTCTTPPGSMPPALYEQQCGFFYVPQESEQRKSCELTPMVFHPDLRRLEPGIITLLTSETKHKCRVDH